MIRSLTLTLATLALPLLPAFGQDPLKEAKFTQVINRVTVVGANQQTTPAKPGLVFRAPETAQTGPGARAELQAADGTITRLGANTSFRFGQEPRTIFLDEGNVLFYSPTGKGGGTIKTAAASAGVMGSTNMVSATRNGGFKVLGLQHRTKVTFNEIPGLFGIPKAKVLKPGQMTFVLPGANRLPPVFEFRLDKLVENSELLRGFGGSPLPSLASIMQNAQVQAEQIASGQKEDTGALIGGVDENGQVNLVDANSRQAVSASQIEAAAAMDEELDSILDELPAYQLDLILDTTEVPDEFVIVDREEFINFLRFYNIPTSFVDNPSIDGEADSSAFDVEVSLSNLAVVGARNIFVRTNRLNLSSLSNRSAIAIFAGGFLVIDQSVFFGGYSGPLGLFGARGVQIEPGSRIGYSGSSLSVQTGGSMSFSQVDFNNLGGAIDFQASDSLTLSNSSITAEGPVFLFAGGANSLNLNKTQIDAVGAVDLESEGNVNLRNSQIRVRDFGASSAFGVRVVSFNRNIGISNTTFDANYIDLAAYNGNLNVFGTSASPMVFPETQIAMEARTISLSNVVFPVGSVVDFYVPMGMLAPGANSGASVMPGYVNFIEGVKYGTSPAENFVPSSQGGYGSPGDPLQIHSTGGGGVIVTPGT